MTRIWKLEEAKSQLSQLVRDAELEPQVITRHGKAVAVVNGVKEESELPHKVSALSALLGNFDFSDMPEEDLFERDRTSDLRDLTL
ncbi:type II toxin-antitoxin system Phd/YefM family antitoxin [Deinococcus sp.]|uniref:type II toxin-antitoxin system Phd/YefM family antitoxin n=1 Tax=Deinococcus sp. TaxID=47478 RepID=UPI0025C42602|nr:type II toxin-antitoxin system Phd/YefM family antitoxin [Deinococcus sp.]